MKKVKDVFYGLCVIWLILVSGLYSVAILLDGLSRVENYSLDGGYLFMTIVAVWTVILKYPVTIWVKRTIDMIKKDFNDRKKMQQKQKQVKAA